MIYTDEEYQQAAQFWRSEHARPYWIARCVDDSADDNAGDRPFLLMFRGKNAVLVARCESLEDCRVRAMRDDALRCGRV